MINIEGKRQIENWLLEDDFSANASYFNSLPKQEIVLELKLKDDMTLAGMSYFCEVFKVLGKSPEINTEIYEGRDVLKTDNMSISFSLPANIALSGERLALNLLQRASSIATQTKKFVRKLENTGIEILDTRKTTPGLRTLEKYAVRAGGGSNHRFRQNDVWMIKDNHKKVFGGLKQAVEHFRGLKSFYTPLVVEIHNIEELKEAREIGVEHVMLDNFSPEQIKESISLKSKSMTYEVSGGITLENISEFSIDGVDAISTSAITAGAAPVDLSLKISE